MFTIIIQEKGGEQRRMVFNKPEVTIGRVQGNDIVLPKGNVSKRHARIVLKDGKFIIVDLKSTNGTYVNGRKITSPLVVKDTDKIYIGDFIVGVDEASAEDGPSETTTSPPGAGIAPPPQDIRPPRPTEAQPMAQMPPGLGVSPMHGMPPVDPPPPPAPAPAPVPMRSGPPRPAPGPSREPPLGRDPASMPPIAPPPVRPNARPGGTMPPPLAPMAPPIAPIGGGMGAPPPAPPPVAPVAQPTSLDGAGPAPFNLDAPLPPRPIQPAPLPAPLQPPPAAPVPVAAAAPPLAPPAPVVPLPSAGSGANSKRALVGAGAAAAVAKKVTRSVSVPSRRGVQLDPLDSKVVKMLDLQSTILDRLRAKVDVDKIPIERLHEEELWQRTENATISLVEALDSAGELPKYIDREVLIKDTLNEALGLGPLEDLLADDQIDEIIIDRRDRVVVGKDGQLRASGRAFSSDEVFDRVVKRLAAEAGTDVDLSDPLIDLRMRDGTRLTAVCSPVSARGACLVLKKPVTAMAPLSALAATSTLSHAMADFLTTCVAARRNVLVCGTPGAGKTSLLAAIAMATPAGERVVSIEDVGELALARDEWVQLETRGGSSRAPAIELANLLDTALRLSPDRLVVGEVTGREAMALVTALCSSTDGAAAAITADNSVAALAKLVTLSRLAAPAAHDSALRELVAQAFEIVVHVARWSDGSIRVLAIDEVVGCNDSGFDLQPLFHFQGGAFSATGAVPRFYSELEARGIPADQAVFR